MVFISVCLLSFILSISCGQSLERIARSSDHPGTDFSGYTLGIIDVGSGAPGLPRPLLCYTQDVNNVEWIDAQGNIIQKVHSRPVASGSSLLSWDGSGHGLSLHRGPVFNETGEYCCVRNGGTHQRLCVTLSPSCGPPNSISGGSYEVPIRTLVGTSVTYTCDDGFFLSGSANVTCQKNLVWTRLPFCTDIPFMALLNTNTTALLSLGSTLITTNNTEILITDIGEDSEGVLPPLTCHTDLTTCCRNKLDNNGMGGLGQWTYPDGSVLQNNASSTAAGQQFYFVRNGPQLIRLSRRQGGNPLSPTGSYCCTVPTSARVVTFCASIVACHSLPPLFNGMITYSDPTFGEGTVATYSCNQLFSLIGNPQRTCNSSYGWSGSAPYCDVPCRDITEEVPDTITYNGGSTNSRPVGTVATYRCRTGYAHSNGNLTRRCQDDGTWSGSECQIFDCGPPEVPTHGQVSAERTVFNSQAHYSCDNCSDIMGVSTRICSSTGVWSPEAPTCQVVDCGPLTAPTNGVVETFPNTECGSVATYSCASGFELRGVVSRTCQRNGQWSNQAPHCLPVDCGPIQNPPNGTVDTSSGTTFMNVATYYCNRGYILKGVSTRNCSSDKQWRPESPVCNPVDCGSLSNPVNGRVDKSSGTTFMNTATYNCHTGYRLIGETSTECQENGEWSSKPVNCTIVDCGPLEAPNNGAVKTELGTTYTEEALFSCDVGYTLNGAASRTCTAYGTWSEITPSCDPVNCGGLKAPASGNVDTSQGTGFMNTAVYSCDPGYTLTGCSVSECLATGSWSCDPPFCADNAIIQLKFGPTHYCVDWTSDKINFMYKAMHIAITTAVQRKGYDIPVENIQQGYFSCYQSTTRTTYRTTITGTERLSAVDYTDMIQEWVESGVTTRVLWYAIKMDKTCPVAVASIDEDECI